MNYNLMGMLKHIGILPGDERQKVAYDVEHVATYVCPVRGLRPSSPAVTIEGLAGPPPV